jgi:uncharacterized protein YlxW (UPF0749 family)
MESILHETPVPPDPAPDTPKDSREVPSAHDRVARAGLDGGCVHLRQKVAARRTVEAAVAAKPAKSRGRSRRRAASATGTAAGAVRQLSAAAEALIAHIQRLENELADARKDRHRLTEIERTLSR